MRLKAKFEDIITIIAPRHIERANEIKILSEKFNLKSQILNKNESILDNKDIIIINYFGALKNFLNMQKAYLLENQLLVNSKIMEGKLEAAKLNCKIFRYIC